jgi:hypothetical protein
MNTAPVESTVPGSSTSRRTRQPCCCGNRAIYPENKGGFVLRGAKSTHTIPRRASIPMNTISTTAILSGVSPITRSATPVANSPGTTTGIGSVRSTSTRWRGSGRCRRVGSGRTGGLPGELAVVLGILRVRAPRPGSRQEPLRSADRPPGRTTPESVMSLRKKTTAARSAGEVFRLGQVLARRWLDSPDAHLAHRTCRRSWRRYGGPCRGVRPDGIPAPADGET